MSETTNLTVEEELEALKHEAEAVDAGEPLPSNEAAENTPTGSGEAEGESDEGSTGEDNSEDGAAGESPDEASGEVLSEDESSSGEDSGDETASEDGEQSVPEANHRRTEKKKEALKRSWENADRRHRDADEREQLLRSREGELMEREQRLSQLEAEVPDDPLPKYSVDEIAESLQEFIEEGELETAKGLVNSLAGKAKALATAGPSQGTGPGSPQFAEAWEQVRGQTIKANPELEDPKSNLYQESTGLLNGEWGALFQSHPAGVAAAVEVAKLRLQAESSSGLSETVEQLKTENEKLKKAVALDGTTPTAKGAAPDKWDNLNLDDQLESLRQEAAALG